MTTTHSAGEELTPEAIAKKPYEKPTFRYEEVFVTSALTCGKTPGGGGNCQGHPHTS